MPPSVLAGIVCAHPLVATKATTSTCRCSTGDHVTDDAGTGFVHTAPGHGRDDFDVWTANGRALAARGINTAIPYTVDENGAFTEDAPGFTGKRVLNDKGEKGDANEAVIKALAEAGMHHRARAAEAPISAFVALEEAGDLPQHAAMVHRDGQADRGTSGGRRCATSRLREAIKTTRWVPAAGENRITGMIESKPDWVISRQRAWGVPIAVFVREKGDGSAEILQDEAVNTRIAEAFEKEGADAWYAGRRARALPRHRAPTRTGQKVDDICDVWFDSGSTHAFVLEDPRHFPALADLKRKHDGGAEVAMYLEGSDQHRGWFHSSLLESCGTRGRAPFDVVLTHGFVLDEHGRKMSKSLGNVDRAAGRDQAVRRRHPAHVGVRLRLCRRPAHRSGNPQDHGRDLPQAAQHDPLDARQPRAFPRGRPRRRPRRCPSSSG